MNLLNSHNILELSINDIIVNAEVSKGGFFHYFKSKQELLSELIKNNIDQSDSLKVGSREHINNIQILFGIYITLSQSSYKKPFTDELSELENLFASSDPDIKYKALQNITNNSYTKSLNFKKNITNEDTNIEKVEEKNRVEPDDTSIIDDQHVSEAPEVEEETVFVSDEFM